jgi:hypothetical protein
MWTSAAIIGGETAVVSEIGVTVCLFLAGSGKSKARHFRDGLCRLLGLTQ